MTTINCVVSDSRSLNQHQPLSHAELDFLRACLPWITTPVAVLFAETPPITEAQEGHSTATVFISVRRMTGSMVTDELQGRCLNTCPAEPTRK